MVGVIEPTQAELISWVVLLVALIIFCTYAWFKAKQDEKSVVVRDWEEWECKS